MTTPCPSLPAVLSRGPSLKLTAARDNPNTERLLSATYVDDPTHVENIGISAVLSIIHSSSPMLWWGPWSLSTGDKERFSGVAER